jgi:hypothetical protein
MTRSRVEREVAHPVLVVDEVVGRGGLNGTIART